ncbi:MucR family transcriptional regulator [Sphingomonas oryzagri]
MVHCRRKALPATTTRSNDLLTLTTGIVAAHLAGNAVQAADVPLLIAAVHHALSRLNPDPSPSIKGPQPAVPIRSSARQDQLVCLTDGRKPKALRHRLMASRAMT